MILEREFTMNTHLVLSQWRLIVFPHTKFTESEFLDASQSNPAINGLVPTEDELLTDKESDFLENLKMKNYRSSQLNQLSFQLLNLRVSII